MGSEDERGRRGKKREGREEDGESIQVWFAGRSGAAVVGRLFCFRFRAGLLLLLVLFLVLVVLCLWVGLVV